MGLYFLFNLTGLLILAALFVEGATELLCKSLFFSKFRVWFSTKGEFYSTLIRCGYCTSLWVSLLPSLIISLEAVDYTITAVPLFFFVMIIVHRVSNYMHNFVDKYLDKFYDPRYVKSEDHHSKD